MLSTRKRSRTIYNGAPMIARHTTNSHGDMLSLHFSREQHEKYGMFYRWFVTFYPSSGGVSIFANLSRRDASRLWRTLSR